jgi:ribonuclease Z
MLKSFQKLGSSAGIPTVNRGTTSLIISENQYDIMVDCGEGTYLKWIDSNYKWNRLKYIFITHMHPDHTAGLIPLIFYRNILRIEPKLTIIGPPNLKEYLLQSFQLQGINLKFELEILSINENPKLNLDNEIKVNSIELEHKVPCWGYRIEDSLNSIVFITDTLPLLSSIEFSKEASHFIHEATFTDEQIELAIETKHTTFSQAVEIGQLAQVKNIYLTHFSPRISDEELKILEKKINFIGLHTRDKIELV